MVWVQVASMAPEQCGVGAGSKHGSRAVRCGCSMVPEPLLSDFTSYSLFLTVLLL